MACDLAPQCHILYRFFQCQLPEDTIDIEIMVRTMKGIYTFKKDHSNQTSSCSPWGWQFHPFPFLVKKMKVYLEESRNIADPLNLTCTYPNRPTISPFAKLQTPKKKKTRNSKKKSRKETIKLIKSSIR